MEIKRYAVSYVYTEYKNGIDPTLSPAHSLASTHTIVLVMMRCCSRLMFACMWTSSCLLRGDSA